MENSGITSFLRLLRKTSDLWLVLLPDRLEDPEIAWGGLLSSREWAEGFKRSSASARRGWLLSRLAAKTAAAGLSGLLLDEGGSSSTGTGGRDDQRQGPAARVVEGEGPGWGLEVLREPEGPPRLEGPAYERNGRQIYITISHTAGAALAAASHWPVGVDIEAWARPFSDRAWQWAFCPEERDLAEPFGSDNRRRLAMWCAKEAAAKRQGLALLNHLAEVRIVEADWPNQCLIVELAGANPMRIKVAVIEDGLFVVALAASSPDGVSPPCCIARDRGIAQPKL